MHMSNSTLFHSYSDVTVMGGGLHRPMLELCREGFYRATPPVTQYLGLHSLVRRTAKFSSILRQTSGTKNSF